MEGCVGLGAEIGPNLLDPLGVDGAVGDPEMHAQRLQTGLGRAKEAGRALRLTVGGRDAAQTGQALGLAAVIP